MESEGRGRGGQLTRGKCDCMEMEIERAPELGLNQTANR